jgi:hypothetical protein
VEIERCRLASGLGRMDTDLAGCPKRDFGLRKISTLADLNVSKNEFGGQMVVSFCC